MDEFDARIAAHMERTNDDWNLMADFPPDGFMTHGEAKAYIEEDLLQRAILVP